MQSLWSRAVQLKSSCRCSLCNPTLEALSKRPGLAAAKRSNLQGDIFLVFSSTLAAEAAIYDSARKKERSHQWEKAIAHERERLSNTENDQRRRIDDLLERAERRRAEQAVAPDRLASRGVTDQERFEKYLMTFKKRGHNTPTRKAKRHNNVFFRTQRLSAINMHRGSSMQYLQWDWQGVFEWSVRCGKMRDEAGFRHWKGLPLNWLKVLNQEELKDLLMDRRLRAWFYGDPRFTGMYQDSPTFIGPRRRLRILEWTIRKMVLRLRRACGPHSNTIFPHGGNENRDKNPETGTNDEATVQLLAEAEENLVMMFEYPRGAPDAQFTKSPAAPNYHWNGDQPGLKRADVNEAIQSHLEGLTSVDDVGRVLSLICESLLVTTMPPNIHTFNAMLLRLSQLKKDKLVHIVLDAMFEANMQPNEITHTTVLRFFTVTNDIGGFCRYVKQMTGRDHGLAAMAADKLRHPLMKKVVRPLGEGGRKVAILARKNQEVYTAIIVGFLRFFTPPVAMYWYRAMINEGWQPSAETLVSILSSCCMERDFSGGIAVWQQFKQEGLETPAQAYPWMLQLCRFSGEEELFAEILLQGIHLGHLSSTIRAMPPEVRYGDVFELLRQVDRYDTKPLSQQGMKDDPPKECKESYIYLRPRVQVEPRVDGVPAAPRDGVAKTVARQRAMILNRFSLELELDKVSDAISEITWEILDRPRMPNSTFSRYKWMAFRVEDEKKKFPKSLQSMLGEYTQSSKLDLHEQKLARQRDELRGVPEHFKTGRDQLSEYPMPPEHALGLEVA